MKIALIHDHLIQKGGAENILAIFHELFPHAPIYTLLYDKKRLGMSFSPETVRPSSLQYIPFSTSVYQWLLPLMPTATESYDLRDYDVVLSSSSAFAKGVITKSTTLHLCYCHTPTRYLWTDTHSYVNDLRCAGIIKKIIPHILTPLRVWDRVAADRVDYFIANSKTVQERIKKYYRRESTVITPPVDVKSFECSSVKGGYYLAGGRLVSYKRIDIVVQAFNRLGLPLKVFGDGPELSSLQRCAKKNIEFLGLVSNEERKKLYQECIAYINPQEEDFGITVIEALASGKPVIAYAAGGSLETIIEGTTGTFFYDQDWAAVVDAVLRFSPEEYYARVIREYALRFSTERFKKEITEYIKNAWDNWQTEQEMKKLRETHLKI